MTGSRRDRMRPFEFIGVALIVGIFTGLIVVMSTRDVSLALIWLGVAFIVMLVASATIVLMVRRNVSELPDDAGNESPPKPSSGRRASGKSPASRSKTT